MSPLEAWLYLDRMDLSRYWLADTGLTWDTFLNDFKEGRMQLEDLEALSPGQREGFRIALEAESYLPTVPSIDTPRPVSPELIGLNNPDNEAPVMVTGNNAFTFEVLASIWSQGTIPAWLLLIDCEGNTVDMAMVFDKFTPHALLAAIERTGLEGKVTHRNLILPGLTALLRDEFAQKTGWNIGVGPICAVELPLFLGNPPRSQGE